MIIGERFSPSDLVLSFCLVLTLSNCSAVVAGESFAQERNMQGVRDFRAKRYVEAEQNYRSALDSLTSVPESNQTRLSILNNLAITLVALHKDKEAQETIREIDSLKQQSGMASKAEATFNFGDNVNRASAGTPLSQKLATLPQRDPTKSTISSGEKLAILMSGVMVGTKLPASTDNEREWNKYFGMGISFRKADQYADAVDNFTKALAYTNAFKPNDLRISLNLTLLAGAHMHLKHYDQADKLYRQSLAVCIKAKGVNSKETATIYDNLGVLYENENLLAKAEEMHQLALSIYEKILDPNSPDIGIALANQAHTQDSLKEYAQSEENFKHSCKVFEALGQTNSKSYAISLDGLGLTYFHQKRLPEARNLSEKALAIFMAELGPDNNDTDVCTVNLMRIYGAQGDKQAALSLLKHKAEAMKAKFGASDPRSNASEETYQKMVTSLKSI